MTATDRGANDRRGIHAQQDAASNWEHMLPDGLGSVRGVVNINNMPVDAHQFTPYGEPISLMGSTASLYGFTGEPTDLHGFVHLPALGNGNFLVRLIIRKLKITSPLSAQMCPVPYATPPL